MPALVLSFRKQQQRVAPTPCQRCIEGRRALYRVKTEHMDMLVCEECAAEARKLGLAPERLR